MVVWTEFVELPNGLQLEVSRSDYPGDIQVCRPTADWSDAHVVRGRQATTWAAELRGSDVRIRDRSGWTVRATVVELDEYGSLVVERNGRRREVPLSKVEWLAAELDLPPGVELC